MKYLKRANLWYTPELCTLYRKTKQKAFRLGQWKLKKQQKKT